MLKWIACRQRALLSFIIIFLLIQNILSIFIVEMKVYFVALINIEDHAGYKPYMNGWLSVWEKFDGEILAVEDSPRSVEGEWPSRRTVILSFPDEATFDAWFHSPEYQELAKHRHSAATSSVALLKQFVMPQTASCKTLSLMSLISTSDFIT